MKMSDYDLETKYNIHRVTPLGPVCNIIEKSPEEWEARRRKKKKKDIDFSFDYLFMEALKEVMEGE